MGDSNFLAKTLTNTVLNRRSFLKWNAALGGTAVLAQGGLSFGMEAADRAEAADEEKVVWSACLVNCGSRCPVRLHVRNGEVFRVTPDNLDDDTYDQRQVRCCVRGHSIRQRIYNPDRLKYPMKRVGMRGEGKFEQITWEEAYDTIANELKRIVDQYGNEAVYINYATGILGGTVAKSWPPGSSPIARLMNCYGGYLNQYGTYSAAQIQAALPYTFGGGWVVGNNIEDIANSKLVVFFGNNPGETRMSGGGIIYSFQHAKEQNNVKVISIDPRYTDTNASLVDEWIPIRPGTDAALVNGLAYVMISENLVDQEFLDTYCVGYDEDHMPDGIPPDNSYKSYILGQGADQTPKTPEWASQITGIPTSKIEQLAREIALSKPAHISQGWGLQRQANGEQNCRAVSMLPILTGNVGIAGGNTGAREAAYSVSVTPFPTLQNPVKASIPVFLWTDAIDHGADMTATKDGIKGVDKLSVPIKFLWNYAGNCIINQHSDTARTRALLQDETKCEMIVVIDNHLTPSAKFADILLPDVTNFEINEITTNGDTGNMGYAIYLSQAIEPLFECRPVYEMCSEIANRLGVGDQFTEGKTHDDWLAYCVEETRKNNADFPDLDSFRQMGIYKVTNPGPPSVAFDTFRQDPEKNPLQTPSGKIEIFSKSLWDISNTWELPEGDVISALPMYVETWEGVADPLREQYPLQMIGHHYKQRTHSTYGNVDWMKEAAPQEVWINPLDADARHIKHGDKVLVFNDRGKLELPAKVTLRIAPGVISVPEGAWYNPNSKGVDEGGCTNTLTTWRPSPLAKGNPQHTNLVEVKKA
jgi:anaerobic dimethyl sulfoxide reductase subunit A